MVAIKGAEYEKELNLIAALMINMKAPWSFWKDHLGYDEFLLNDFENYFDCEHGPKKARPDCSYNEDLLEAFGSHVLLWPPSEKQMQDVLGRNFVHIPKRQQYMVYLCHKVWPNER